MSTQSLAPSNRHSPWQDLLQIVGALAIVAFHTGFPGAKAGWVAVELFFVLAGFRMAGTRETGQGVGRFLMERTRRLMPELIVVWLVCLALVVIGSGTSGMRWFLLTAPFHLQNLSVILFDYQLPRDAVFGPLWFTASLVQLQIACFMLRKWLNGAKPMMIAASAVAVGVVARIAFAKLHGGSIMHPTGAGAGVLYCMPFCHMEAIVFGWLLKRGAFPHIGKLLPIIIPCILGCGLLVAFRKASGFESDFGYVFPLRDALSHAWGYPLLAIGATSVVAIQPYVDQFLGKLNGLRMSLSLANRFALLTYGVYCFHGLFIAAFANIGFLNSPGFSGHSLRFSVILACSLATAAIVRSIPSYCLRKHP